MVKFLAGFGTALFLVGLYLSSITIPEYIIQYECTPAESPVKKKPDISVWL